jgi:hypothetical protein
LANQLRFTKSALDGFTFGENDFMDLVLYLKAGRKLPDRGGMSEKFFSKPFITQPKFRFFLLGFVFCQNFSFKRKSAPDDSKTKLLFAKISGDGKPGKKHT